MRHTAAIAALLAGLPACQLAALQCADGAPPPCRGAARTPAAPGANSVAVLTFDNLSRDTADTYLVQGLANDISSQLGRIERLAVASRTMVRRLPNAATMTPQAIGRSLNAAWLVNGGVQRGAGRVRVTVELVRSTTGQSVWSDQYDRAANDLLDIQRDVATAVASEVAGRLTPQERRTIAAPAEINREAYDQLLRGDFLVAKRTQAGFEMAITAYQTAVHLDPRSARAHAGLGNTYNICVDWAYPCLGLPRDSLRSRADVAVDRALALDSLNPWALEARASVVYDVNLTEGLRYADRAIAVSPRTAAFHHMRAWILAEMLRTDDALAAYHRALALDPGSAVTWLHIARVQTAERRFAEALSAYDSAIAIEPDLGQALPGRALLRAWTGDSVSARADAAALARREPNAAMAAGIQASIEALIAAVRGDTARAGALADSLWSAGVRNEFTGTALSRLGRRATVLALMPDDWAIDPFWARMPYYDGNRADPRFQAAVERARRRQNPQ
jgi:serine/threonine-protein kinase